VDASDGGRVFQLGERDEKFRRAVIEENVLITIERVGVEQKPLAAGQHVRVEIDVARHFSHGPRLSGAIVFVNRQVMPFEDRFQV